MATETARIKFYTVKECGYFKHGKENPAFGDLANILNQLENWATGASLDLVDTKTYEADEGDDGLYPAYCFDIQHEANTGDYLLTTWNEIPTTEGQRVASVKPNSKVGSADVDLTELPEDNIAGYATYFWFAPSEGVFASIKFDTSRLANGHRQLKKYMSEFMAKWTSYAVRERKNGSTEFEVNGYAATGKEKDAEHHYPRFTSAPMRTETSEQRIKSRQPLIRKVIRKNKIGSGLVTGASLSWFQAVFGYLMAGTKKVSPPDDPVRAKYEVSHTPSSGELDSMIATWKENQDDNSKWDDLGFQFKGESGTIWLSDSLIKDDIELEVDRKNDEVVTANSILKSVTKMRSHLLDYLP